jgi:ribosomal protein S18 acetylase RimI-like enzyme
MGLIEQMLGKANQAGWAELSLTGNQDNTKAQALYRRLGIDEEAICLEKHVK